MSKSRGGLSKRQISNARQALRGKRINAGRRKVRVDSYITKDGVRVPTHYRTITVKRKIAQDIAKKRLTKAKTNIAESNVKVAKSKPVKAPKVTKKADPNWNSVESKVERLSESSNRELYKKLEGVTDPKTIKEIGDAHIKEFAKKHGISSKTIRKARRTRDLSEKYGLKSEFDNVWGSGHGTQTSLANKLKKKAADAGEWEDLDELDKLYPDQSFVGKLTKDLGKKTTMDKIKDKAFAGSKGTFEKMKKSDVLKKSPIERHTTDQVAKAKSQKVRDAEDLEVITGGKIYKEEDFFDMDDFSDQTELLELEEISPGKFVVKSKPEHGGARKGAGRKGSGEGGKALPKAERQRLIRVAKRKTENIKFRDTELKATRVEIAKVKGQLRERFKVDLNRETKRFTDAKQWTDYKRAIKRFEKGEVDMQYVLDRKPVNATYQPGVADNEISRLAKQTKLDLEARYRKLEHKKDLLQDMDIEMDGRALKTFKKQIEGKALNSSYKPKTAQQKKDLGLSKWDRYKGEEYEVAPSKEEIELFNQSKEVELDRIKVDNNVEARVKSFNDKVRKYNATDLSDVSSRGRLKAEIEVEKAELNKIKNQLSEVENRLPPTKTVTFEGPTKADGSVDARFKTEHGKKLTETELETLKAKDVEKLKKQREASKKHYEKKKADKSAKNIETYGTDDKDYIRYKTVEVHTAGGATVKFKANPKTGELELLNPKQVNLLESETLVSVKAQRFYDTQHAGVSPNAEGGRFFSKGANPNPNAVRRFDDDGNPIADGALFIPKGYDRPQSAVSQNFNTGEYKTAEGTGKLGSGAVTEFEHTGSITTVFSNLPKGVNNRARQKNVIELAEFEYATNLRNLKRTGRLDKTGKQWLDNYNAGKQQKSWDQYIRRIESTRGAGLKKYLPEGFSKLKGQARKDAVFAAKTKKLVDSHDKYIKSTFTGEEFHYTETIPTGYIDKGVKREISEIQVFEVKKPKKQPSIIRKEGDDFVVYGYDGKTLVKKGVAGSKGFEDLPKAQGIFSYEYVKPTEFGSYKFVQDRGSRPGAGYFEYRPLKTRSGVDVPDIPGGYHWKKSGITGKLEDSAIHGLFGKYGYEIPKGAQISKYDPTASLKQQGFVLKKNPKTVVAKAKLKYGNKIPKNKTISHEVGKEFAAENPGEVIQLGGQWFKLKPKG